jgi:hypothetical protein
MSKQTAVEWLVEQLIPNAMRMFDATTCNAIEQAKQMEKEQIKGAWYDGISGGQCGDSEQYYNETYGGGEQ